MRLLALFALLLTLGSSLRAQYVYTINADSVKITNHCDTAELIIENHTQSVPGFLFNKGRGRTEFRQVAIKLNDSVYLIGTDTLFTSRPSFWKANGNHIYNVNTGNVGIHRTNPNVLLDLPGPVNIDDTSAYRIHYRPVLRVGGWLDSIPGYYDLDDNYVPAVPVHSYTNLYAGDSAGANNSGNFVTLVGADAGHDNVGDNNTFVGYLSGRNNSVGPFNAPSTENSFFGNHSGENNTGMDNTFIGYFSGNYNSGVLNTSAGSYSGAYSSGTTNCFLGYFGGIYNTGNDNCFLGPYSGESNGGDKNTFVGEYAGAGNHGNNCVFMGYAAGESSYGGDANVAIGYNAGYFLYQASGVTVLGSNANTGGTPITNAAAIGAHAKVVTSNTMVFGDTATKTWLFNSNASAGSGIALVVGSNSTNGNGAYLTTGGVWTNASDRDKKENFEPVNGDDLLEKVAALPISRWNYKGLPEQHIGPMAQDFYRLFHIGVDDKTISTIDPSGIALAGIQELYLKWQQATQKLEEQQNKINDMESRLQQQQAQLAQLLEKFNKLETAPDKKTKP